MSDTSHDLNAAFDAIQARLDRLEKTLREGLDRLEARLVGVGDRTDSLENRMDSLEAHLTAMETRLSDALSKVEAQVKDLKTHVDPAPDFPNPPTYKA